MGANQLKSLAAVPNLSDTKDHFHGRQFFQGWEWGWFQDDSSTLHYCAFYFYYYYISSTSDHQALDPWELGTPVV